MTAKWPFYSQEVAQQLLDCFAHGDLGGVNGHPAVARFEEMFARRLAPGHRTAFFNSGTSALCAGLFALKLRKGGEVIVPRRTFRSTVSPLIQFGLVPRFAECGSDGCVSVQSVRALAGSCTVAILLTHQWGQPADLDGLSAIAQAQGLVMIEDCSHAHGTSYRGQPVGTFGTFSFFSCGTTKSVSGGTGGTLVTRHADLFDRAIAYGQPKSRCDAIESPHVRRLGRVGAGVNLRGNPFSAALAMDHLLTLDKHIAQKNRNLALVDEIVHADCAALAPVPRQHQWTSGTWYKRPYTVSASLADNLIREASLAGIALTDQDPPLDELLMPVAQEYGLKLQAASPVVHGSRLLLLNTLDMYSDHWNAAQFQERVRRLSSVVG